MRLLFDTHAFIWWDSEPAKLSARALASCSDPQNVLLLSVASVWEMQIKVQLGKLTLRSPLSDLIAEQVSRNAVEILPITLDYVLALDGLVPRHRDPFDRMLAAQAQVEQVPLVSGDRVFADYHLDILW